MTSTTKTANGNRSAPAKEKTALGDGWDDVPRATGGGAECAEWCPQLTDLKEDKAQIALSIKPEGSHYDPVVIGKPLIEQAYGEPRYFLDTDKGRIALPTHAVLTSALDRYDLGSVAMMRISCDGKSNRQQSGRQPAFIYDVRAKGADGKPVHPLTEARKDALYPVHKANKAKRDSEDGADDEAKHGQTPGVGTTG